jgi:hypothetical protein
LPHVVLFRSSCVQVQILHLLISTPLAPERLPFTRESRRFVVFAFPSWTCASFGLQAQA